MFVNSLHYIMLLLYQVLKSAGDFEPSFVTEVISLIYTVRKSFNRLIENATFFSTYHGWLPVKLRPPKKMRVTKMFFLKFRQFSLQITFTRIGLHVNIPLN